MLKTLSQKNEEVEIALEESNYEEERKNESEDDSIHQIPLQRHQTFAPDVTDLGNIEMETVNRLSRSKKIDLESNRMRLWQKKTKNY